MDSIIWLVIIALICTHLNTFRIRKKVKALINHDIWQFGIVIFICLTGCLPWQKAAFDDPRYLRAANTYNSLETDDDMGENSYLCVGLECNMHNYYNWYNSANPLKRQPKLWKMVSSRAQKLFKKFVEPRVDKRASNFNDLPRFIDDRWMAKGYTDRVAGGDIDELCPSMYSFHSDPNEKHILLKHFRENGIEISVDRQAKKQRIRDWIQNSVIEEADEEEPSNYEPSIYDDSDAELEDRSRPHPIDESHKVALRYDTEKHINPRTGEVIEGVKRPPDKNPLSYDVQNIEPVAPANVVRRYGIKDEGASHSSTKDSAYGSIEAARNSPHRKQKSHLDITSHNSPSRSLSAVSLQNNQLPLSVPVQRFQKSEEVYSQELENVTGSTANLKSAPSSSRSNSIQVTRNSSTESAKNVNSDVENRKTENPVIINNGINSNSNPVTNSYVSMKNSVYENVTRNDSTKSTKTDKNLSDQATESPYTSMLNIVQGQMKISPHAQDLKRNVVNVSVTQYNRDKK